MKRIELDGTKVGKWNILEYIGNKKYLCVYDCGNIKFIWENKDKSDKEVE